jgi:hypothetical protein
LSPEPIRRLTEEIVAELKLGVEVESWCTKCREMRKHVVVTLAVAKKAARVRCDTCDGEHNYRPSPPQSRRSSAAKPATRKKMVLSLTDDQKAVALPYKIASNYQMGDVITHPTFGFGEVIEVKSPQRLMILFDTSQKLLIQNTLQA